MTNAIDLFSGAGGFTTGAIAAGANVLACGNHWGEAIEIHRANHPGVRHIKANLLELDPHVMPRHDLLLASPACQGFSEASQPKRRPKHEADRNTCWAVVCMAEAHRPRTVLIENVVALQRWALFPVWLDALKRLGYHVETHRFDVSEWGVPQNRERLIVSARLDAPLRLRSPRLDPIPFGPLVDWERGEWAPIASKPAGVQRRVRRGWDRGLGERFLVHYSSDNPGREYERPIGTVTTKVQWAAVRGPEIRMLSIAELRRAMGFPAGYLLPATKSLACKMLGNAIPPEFARRLVEQALAA